MLHKLCASLETKTHPFPICQNFRFGVINVGARCRKEAFFGTSHGSSLACVSFVSASSYFGGPSLHFKQWRYYKAFFFRPFNISLPKNEIKETRKGFSSCGSDSDCQSEIGWSKREHDWGRQQLFLEGKRKLPLLCTEEVIRHYNLTYHAAI